MIRVFVFVRYLFTCNYRSSHANDDSSYKILVKNYLLLLPMKIHLTRVWNTKEKSVRANVYRGEFTVKITIRPFKLWTSSINMDNACFCHTLIACNVNFLLISLIEALTARNTSYTWEECLFLNIKWPNSLLFFFHWKIIKIMIINRYKIYLWIEL